MREDPHLRAAWQALEPRRRLVAALLAMRARANLTQKELAERVGWRTAFVRRMESFPRDGETLSMPALSTLAAYAAACGCESGVVFGRASGRATLEIAAVMGLGDDRRFLRGLCELERTEIRFKAGAVESIRPLGRRGWAPAIAAHFWESQTTGSKGAKREKRSRTSPALWPPCAAHRSKSKRAACNRRRSPAAN